MSGIIYEKVKDESGSDVLTLGNLQKLQFLEVLNMRI